MSNYFLWVWVFCTVALILDISKEKWLHFEQKVVDIAWDGMMPKKIVVCIAAIVFIILSPYFFVLMITKPLRKSK